MGAACWKKSALRGVVALAWLCLTAATARAQDAAPAPGGDGPTVKDSSVGYIDSAVPFSHVRLRFDAAYDGNRPNRAEFFYARGAPLGPGLPVPEPRIDYQEATTYLELAVRPWLSGFVEAPVRLLNPEVNDNSAGYGDTVAGFKVAFYDTGCSLATFQLKTYIPTGDADRGLGTDHVSIEPGILFNHGLSERLTLEGEFRYWIPIGGTDFAGDIVRYGLGLSYGRRCPDRLWVTPVVEFVGWTVLDGQQTAVNTPTSFAVLDASGDTIINMKAGVRAGVGDLFDVYAGYGRALTGEVWYKDIWRVELRLLF